MQNSHFTSARNKTKCYCDTQTEHMKCDTSIETAGDAFAGGALEVGRGPVDEGTGLSRLRLRPAAVAELGAQSQELGLGGLFRRNQPVNRAKKPAALRGHKLHTYRIYMCSDADYASLFKSRCGVMFY